MSRLSGGLTVLLASVVVAVGFSGAASAVSPVGCVDIPKNAAKGGCLPPESNRLNHRHSLGDHRRGHGRRNHRGGHRGHAGRISHRHG
jgi:hypothetical protein